MYEGKNIHYSAYDNKPLCSFSVKLCKQRRLNGYAFCVRHILEDPTAPFKQCGHTTRHNKQQCNNPIPQNEPRQYCNNHMQMLGMLPKKERKKKDTTPKVEPVSTDAKMGLLPQDRISLQTKIKDRFKSNQSQNIVGISGFSQLNQNIGGAYSLAHFHANLNNRSSGLGPEDPYAFEDMTASPSTPAGISGINNILNSSPNVSQNNHDLGNLNSHLSPVSARSPVSLGKSPSPIRPELIPFSFTAAKLYPELAEKLHTERGNKGRSESKSRSVNKRSRTMKQLENKIAQNKINDKLKKNQDVISCPSNCSSESQHSSPAFDTQSNSSFKLAPSSQCSTTPGSQPAMTPPLCIDSPQMAPVLEAVCNVLPHDLLSVNPSIQTMLQFAQNAPTFPPPLSPTTSFSSTTIRQNQVAHNCVADTSPSVVLSQTHNAVMHCLPSLPVNQIPAATAKLSLASAVVNPSSNVFDSSKMNVRLDSLNIDRRFCDNFKKDNLVKKEKPRKVRNIQFPMFADTPSCASRLHLHKPQTVLAKSDQYLRLKRLSAVSVYEHYSHRRLYNSDLVPVGLDTSGSESSGDDSGEDDVPWQYSWFTPSSDDEPDSDEQEESLEIQRTTRLAMKRARIRRRFLQMHKIHQANNDVNEHHSKVTKTLVDAVRDQSRNALLALRATQDIFELPVDRFKLQGLRRRTCLHVKDDVQCTGPVIPYANHCRKHIMYNVEQQLFDYCTAKLPDNTQCCDPSFDIRHDLPLCPKHAHVVDSQPQEAVKRKRKKTKPSALTRPPKRGKKKRNQRKQIRPEKPIIPLDVLEKETDTGGASSSAETSELMDHITTHDTENSSKSIENHMDDDLGVFSPIDKTLVLPLESKILEDSDINEVLNKLPEDAFNDLFNTGKNGDYGPLKEETDEFEKALAAVSMSKGANLMSDDDDELTKHIADSILQQEAEAATGTVQDHLSNTLHDDNLHALANSITETDLKNMSQVLATAEFNSVLGLPAPDLTGLSLPKVTNNINTTFSLQNLQQNLQQLSNSLNSLQASQGQQGFTFDPAQLQLLCQTQNQLQLAAQGHLIQGQMAHGQFVQIPTLNAQPLNSVYGIVNSTGAILNNAGTFNTLGTGPLGVTNSTGNLVHSFPTFQSTVNSATNVTLNTVLSPKQYTPTLTVASMVQSPSDQQILPVNQQQHVTISVPQQHCAALTNHSPLQSPLQNFRNPWTQIEQLGLPVLSNGYQQTSNGPKYTLTLPQSTPELSLSGQTVSYNASPVDSAYQVTAFVAPPTPQTNS